MLDFIDRWAACYRGNLANRDDRGLTRVVDRNIVDAATYGSLPLIQRRVG